MISFISTSFKKDMYSKSYDVAKKLQDRQFLQNCLSEKAPGSKKSFGKNPPVGMS